jgi:hypothetical protein
VRASGRLRARSCSRFWWEAAHQVVPAIEARAQVIGGVRVRSVGMLGGVLLEGEVGCVAAVAEERHATGRERHRGVGREGRDRQTKTKAKRVRLVSWPWCLCGGGEIRL